MSKRVFKPRSSGSRRGPYFEAQAMRRAGALAGARALVFRRNRGPRIKGAIPVQQELKFVDSTLSNLACDTTGSVTALNLLAVGDDNTTRDGRQVTIKSVQIKGLIAPIDNDINSNISRVLLVWDNAVNSGSIATIAQILTAATGTAFPLVDNANRFTILWDYRFAMGAAVSTATQAQVFTPSVGNADYYKKLNLVTQYSGTTAAIGSIQNGALLFVTVGTQAAGLGGAFNGHARVRFVDN